MATARTKCISTKVTVDEYALCARVVQGTTVSAWARQVLLATASPAPSIAQTVLAEVLALRTIVLNLQFALASGEPLTAEAMQRLVERADYEKVQKAYDRVAPVSDARRR